MDKQTNGETDVRYNVWVRMNHVFNPNIQPEVGWLTTELDVVPSTDDVLTTFEIRTFLESVERGGEYIIERMMVLAEVRR